LYCFVTETQFEIENPIKALFFIDI